MPWPRTPDHPRSPPRPLAAHTPQRSRGPDRALSSTLAMCSRAASVAPGGYMVPGQSVHSRRSESRSTRSDAPGRTLCIGNRIPTPPPVQPPAAGVRGSSLPRPVPRRVTEQDTVFLELPRRSQRQHRLAQLGPLVRRLDRHLRLGAPHGGTLVHQLHLPPPLFRRQSQLVDFVVADRPCRRLVELAPLVMSRLVLTESGHDAPFRRADVGSGVASGAFRRPLPDLWDSSSAYPHTTRPPSLSRHDERGHQ